MYTTLQIQPTNPLTYSDAYVNLNPFLSSALLSNTFSPNKTYVDTNGNIITKF